MATKKINIGQLANDGTGDDIRTAFDKINDNFVDLDTRFPTAATGVNLGSLGENVFESNTNSELSFKKLIAGSHITLSSSATGITISGTTDLDQLIAVSDSGTVTVSRGQTMSVQGLNGITTSVIGQNLYVSGTTGVVGSDTLPTLSANLNANNKNIINGGTITASGFYGPIEGLVYGIDVREIGNAGPNAWDFGSISETYTSLLDYIGKSTNVDLGTYVGAGVASGEIDLGSIAV
jgi:hypothetical protein